MIINEQFFFEKPAQKGGLFYYTYKNVEIAELISFGFKVCVGSDMVPARVVFVRSGF